MTDEELFNILKRKGEKWLPDIYYLFNVPENGWLMFGWLWERAREKDWWLAFLELVAETTPWHNESPYTLFTHYIIHPTRFRDALKEYFEGEG